jgi:hypothetical protein
LTEIDPGISRDPAQPLEEWNRPPINQWRVKAQGCRVHSVPLWKYCDDTSGNVSKKWNKHNSILFTLAGLPRALTQMLYNIHFIVTSNLSPPLEMIEAVVAMLKYFFFMDHSFCLLTEILEQGGANQWHQSLGLRVQRLDTYYSVVFGLPGRQSDVK